MSQLVDDLKATKVLIDTPEKWTKGANARGKSGRPVKWRSRVAVCRSLLGAVRIATRAIDDRYIAVRDAIREVTGGPVVFWNDAPERTHAEVMAVFDKAIAAAEASAIPGRPGSHH